MSTLRLSGITINCKVTWILNANKTQCFVGPLEGSVTEANNRKYEKNAEDIYQHYQYANEIGKELDGCNWADGCCKEGQ